MTNPASEKLGVKYVLYTHYPNDEEDFRMWQAETAVAELPGVKLLLNRLRPLHNLLTAPGYEGLLVLFYAPGLHECLDGMADGIKLDALLDNNPILRFAEKVSEYVNDELKKDLRLSRRVRFVTALDLFEIFGRVHEHHGQFRAWFIGVSPTVHYDAPKIVEAIVRLRLLGNGVPVFRVDWDVLFSEDDLPITNLALFKAIAICLKAYRLRLDDPTVATFLFSASYDYSKLSDTSRGSAYEDWRGAFATRVVPALRVMPKLVAKVDGPKFDWDKYAAKAFDEGLARQFYGLLPKEIKCDGAKGLTKIGAHPLSSVISGAFLCLSDGAILDLPPFSNFALNVVWIDDHLKYSLHRELRHLTSLDLRLAGEPRLSDAKLDDVMVKKRRRSVGDLPEYVLETYLPSLLWGAVVDSWINPDPLLKCRPDDLSEDDNARWHGLPRNGNSKALLPLYLQGALQAGLFSDNDRPKLAGMLIDKALERINEVREAWSQLTDSAKCETFASIWAKGSVHKYFSLAGRARGIAPDLDITHRITRDVQLNPELLNDLRQLVTDALDYIDWTIYWPRIVRTVRSIEQGTLRTDMSWSP